MLITDSTPTPQEQPVETATMRRRLTIGLPANTLASESRFPLTPEGVKSLTNREIVVKIEKGAAAPIHYADNAYARCGAEVVDRADALACDIVISLAPLTALDVNLMRRGAMLLTLLNEETLPENTVRAMQRHNLICVAVDLIADERGNRPFADIMAELDGRAAISKASAMLGDPQLGKGILLGGVAGVGPCEVTIIGSGLAACAAARSAIGLGAMVRIFDDDVYGLRAALKDLDQMAVGSVLHDKVLDNALRSADVVVMADTATPVVLGPERVDVMKRGVLVFDLTSVHGRAFPSLPCVDMAVTDSKLSTAEGPRRCYVNAGSSVPRTAAMAMSSAFTSMLRNVVSCDGAANAIKFTPGMSKGVVIFRGRVTNPSIAAKLRCGFTDVNIFLQFS